VAGLLYLDASAIVKLVVEEPESSALRDTLRNRPHRVLQRARRRRSPPRGRPAFPGPTRRLLTAAQVSGLRTEDPR